MPLGLTMHGKWDGISMATSPLHTYKHERPAYSTPQPVENTPANNECRMVDLRGAKVASFFVGGDEFICLPQAFDLFLKHLVGGLHTVYTKLKRLSISPVVCNVEQVRILRGLGAIQPGVNRCKLITRKDFETLYQDCTQASRPGRPPKRYPMLPPTTDLMSQHPGIRSLGNAHGLLTASDISNLHKRMRLEQDVEKHLHQQERRISESPPKDNPVLPGKDLTLSGGNEIHPNATNLYLQAQQALRQQYQQVASTSLHNGLDNPHSAVAAAGMNPALAPLMMMSHPALFTGAIPPSMLNHINQFAQNHANGNAVSNAAAVAAAQIAANGGNMHQQAAAAYQVAAAAQSAAHASLVAARASRSNSPQEESGSTSASLKEERVSDNHERTPKINDNVSHNSASLMNGFGSEGRISPASSISSHIEDENLSNGSLSANSDSRDSMKFIEENDDDLRRESPSFVTKLGNNSTIQQNQENQSNADDTLENNDGADDNGEQFINADISQVLAGQGNISSMQTLLTNIQGLLKVAADNAKLQDKHSSFEIADLKNRINNEKQKRGSTEKKLQESERIRALMQRRLKKERKVRKLLQEQLLKMQQKIDNEEESEQQNKIAAAPSMPIRGVFGLGRESVIPPSTSPPPYTQQSPQTVSPGCEKDMSPSSNENISISGTTLLTAASSGGSSLITAVTSYPSSRECGTFSSSLSTISSSNNNNNNTASFVKYTRKSPSPTRTGERRLSSDQDLDMNEIQFKKHLPVQPTIPSSHLFFKTAHFQTTMSQ